MNRKKKINEILKKKQKKKNAKLHKSNKPKYISKADRAKMEAEQASTEESGVETSTPSDS
ncbi:conserved hypothetical protein [Vibrio nigripulchritudo SFn27]|uniref:DUF2986 domain-containing protein n=2 Tax=Vibrio nigripulchritudo TaxID=28173 RepID=U4KD65_9VIBR|nr:MULTISPECIES: DUF2986 domain-containing protein [Vibrio]KJY76328.1 hypothetical protein TW74_14775 [Vibrio nigripulchritudo]UAB72352.1 DUF2986 domain-containing protein [Vibrio sp. SCSIO 43132]CCN32916.1 conserved hypothetical protein [Vibrio nigripulchritudo AM115]CCN40397.1 conserved hypothetical protein [Vibrio nigripulchritudo FTn2]CCN65278.1 conserved hypothetical protein [Vibrio nigripulchritudo POn4]